MIEEIKWEKLIFSTGLIGTLFVLAAASMLLWYNPSPKVVTPLVAAVAAIITVFLSTYFLLKETKIESSFPVSIVINREEKLPERFFGQPNSKQSRRDIATLARPVAEMGINPPLAIEIPKNDDEIIRFSLELLAYKIFKNIEHFQRREWQSGIDIGKGGGFSEVYNRIELTKKTIYSGAELMNIESINKFSHDSTDMRKLSGKLIVPKGTKIEFKAMSASVKAGPKQYFLILNNRPFFTIIFTIESMGSYYPGVPQDVSQGLSLEEIRKFQTFNYKVKMQAIFHSLTSENPIIEEYKNWTHWIFEEMKKDMSE